MKDTERLLPRRAEGVREARWTPLDYLDCVLYVFTPEARGFYRLDNLWGEAPTLEPSVARNPVDVRAADEDELKHDQLVSCLQEDIGQRATGVASRAVLAENPRSRACLAR